MSLRKQLPVLSRLADPDRVKPVEKPTVVKPVVPTEAGQVKKGVLDALTGSTPQPAEEPPAKAEPEENGESGHA